MTFTRASGAPGARAIQYVLILGLAIGFTSWGSHGGQNTPSSPSGSDTALLIQLNARFNEGRTVRWASLPIPVFTNGIAREAEVTAWTAATGGAVTFAFVGSPAAGGINFRFGSGNDVCGLANIQYTTDGRITSVDIQVVEAIFRGPQCQRTVVTRPGMPSGSWPTRRMGG